MEVAGRLVAVSSKLLSRHHRLKTHGMVQPPVLAAKSKTGQTPSISLPDVSSAADTDRAGILVLKLQSPDLDPDGPPHPCEPRWTEALSPSSDGR